MAKEAVQTASTALMIGHGRVAYVLRGLLRHARGRGGDVLMCGILGWFGDMGGDAGRFGTALDLLAHRGPDDRGVFVAPGVLLGHRRLSILDLSPAGHQPMVDPASVRSLSSMARYTTTSNYVPTGRTRSSVCRSL